MKTELTKDYFAKGGDMIDTWMNMTPMNRPGVPEELQGAALYLAQMHHHSLLVQLLLLTVVTQHFNRIQN